MGRKITLLTNVISNEEYYHVVDDNMKPNISYFDKPKEDSVGEDEKHIIDQNDVYKAYFNLNYDNFCNFDTHFDTTQKYK